MAWISVHESVLGPKLRRLLKQLDTSSFECLGILNCLWLWGLNNADENGRILDATTEDIERHLYGVAIGCDLDMKKVVSALIDTGWIDLTNDGMFLHDWAGWQELWYKAKARRKHDVDRKREKAEERAAKKAQAADAQQKQADSVPPEKHPEEHAALIVRVCGFSAQFVSLEPSWQEEFINRNFYKL